MEDSTDLIKLRREKLAQLYDRGINPYINRFKVKDAIGLLVDEFSANSKEELEKIDKQCLVGGRMMARRGHGKTTFCHIKDRAGQIQVYIRKDEIGDENYEIFSLLDIGDLLALKEYCLRRKQGNLQYLQKKSLYCQNHFCHFQKSGMG